MLINLRAIGVSYAWFRDQARRLEAAGYDGVAVWDHFVSRGIRRDPVLESWTTLAALAGSTSTLRLMTFVLNVMNRPPSVVARMAATLEDASGGRLVLGLGIGGHPAEHLAYEIPFPDVPERVARLEEAVAVIRALWSGGPSTAPRRSTHFARHTRSRSRARPRRSSSPARAERGRLSPGGSATGGRCPPHALSSTFRPTWRPLPTRAGHDPRRRFFAAFDLAKGQSLAGTAWADDPAGSAARWQAAGADGAVVGARSTEDVDCLVDAAGRR